MPRWRMAVGLILCLAVGWGLMGVMQRWQEHRERSLYEGRTIHEWVDLALTDTYWSAHWATYNEPEYADSAAEQKVIAIGAPAVPELVARLRSLHTGAVQHRLILWRVKYWPRWAACPAFLDLHHDVSGDVALINYLLSQMGEAARPAVPAMVASSRDVHIWAYYDLLDDFVRMGPVAHEALPELKRRAKKGDADAARAVRYMEKGRTELRSDDDAEEEKPPAPSQN